MESTGTTSGAAAAEDTGAFRFGAAVLAAERAKIDGGLAALRAARRLADGVANGRTSAARRTGATALLLADIPTLKEKKPKKQENHEATRFSFVQRKEASLSETENGFSRPSNYCDGPMVRSRSWRTEEERRGGNSHPRRLTTNNDARIFTQVTKCHKKAHTHALPPALPLTHLARQTLAPLGAAAAAPPPRRSTYRQQPTAHIQIHIRITTTNPPQRDSAHTWPHDTA